MHRHVTRREKAAHRIEIEVYNPLRILWATIMNRHRGSKEKIYKPADLLKLSIDKEDEQTQEVKKFDMKAVIGRIGKTFKKK